MTADDDRTMLRRRGETLIAEALKGARVVLINGPRQSGKSTLARLACEAAHGTYVTLDSPAALAAATHDPAGFVAGGGPLFIDEVQRGGDPLVLAVKEAVDRSPRRGRFVLTGSTRFLTMPKISESLAGRMRIVDLWPLSQGEIEPSGERFVDRLFASTSALRDIRAPKISQDDVFRRICRGGFPEVLDLSARQRRGWFDSYVRTVIQRDVRDLARVRQAADLHRVLKLLAARTAQETNVSALADELGLPRTTIDEHAGLLEAVFLTFPLRAWSRNLTAKVVRHSKVHMTDSGLAAHLLGVDAKGLTSITSPMRGPLFETFVAGEIARQLTWSETSVEPFHFRDRDGAEVDLVLETPDGRVAAVATKSALSVSARDFRHLEGLRKKLGTAFVNGVVIYCGPQVLAFGDRMTAMPVSALWAG